MQTSTTRSLDLGLFLIRAMIGVVFVYHGAQKLFGWFGGYGLEGTAGFMETLGLPLPMASALMAGATEFFGGLALLTGVFHRLLAAPLTITMLVAAFTAHSGFGAANGGMEYPLTLAIVSAGLFFTGPGSFRLTFARALEARLPFAPREGLA